MSDPVFDSDAVRDALTEAATRLSADVEIAIKSKLSGDVLNVRSGALRDSIAVDVTGDTDMIAIDARSEGVPYAAIQEYGGKTSAHDIVAVKGKVLAFVAGGRTIFARSVHHPGSSIPAHAFIGGTLDEMHDVIASDLKQAILDTLQAS